MRLSVVICTRNRADQLERALRSISQCVHPPQGDWELIVIDNGSSDHTSQVIDAAISDLPAHCVVEPIPGLSHARNTAVDVAQGEWILWTDDDVTVDADWLTGYRDAIDRYPDAQVLGGPIRVVFDGDPPQWLQQGVGTVRSAYAGLEPNDVTTTFGCTGRVPYGANFAIRRSYLREFGFDTSLGRHPAHPMRSGEETPVIRNALQRGPGYWLDGAQVHHHIDGARQTKRYVRSYYYGYGFRQGAVRAHADPLRTFARETVKSLFAAGRAEIGLLRRSPSTATLLKQAAQSWGRVVGASRNIGVLLRRQSGGVTD